MVGAETRESVEKQVYGLASVVAADTLALLGQVHCQGESRLPIKRKIFQIAEALCVCGFLSPFYMKDVAVAIAV